MIRAPALDETRLPSLHVGLSTPRIESAQNHHIWAGNTYNQRTLLRSHTTPLDRGRHAIYRSLHTFEIILTTTSTGHRTVIECLDCDPTAFSGRLVKDEPSETFQCCP